jgi:hypothetical protein
MADMHKQQISPAILLALLAAALVSPSAPALEIVVPAYFYPSAGSPWGPMTAAADEVPITAIMNPGNGPGSFKDNNYVNAVNAFRDAGGRVLGYVHTSYGARSLAQVLADVDKYDAWYGIDGIFVDEMANTGPAQKLEYYKDIYEHAKAIDPQWEVMGNPGTHTIQQYVTWPTADRFMVFEGHGVNYPAYVPSDWNVQYDSSKFVHLVHTEPSAQNMENYLQLAVQRNAGGIYVTDDVMNNPWDTLPSYWQAEVAAVAAMNATFAAADFNQDGQVNADDLAEWRSGFAAGSTRAEGDANYDAAVDGADFLQWQLDLGATAAATNAAAIPEPATIVLLATTLAWVARPERAWSTRAIPFTPFQHVPRQRQ